LEAEELEAQQYKGKAKPVSVYRVTEWRVAASENSNT